MGKGKTAAYEILRPSAVETVFFSGWKDSTAVAKRLTPRGMTSFMGLAMPERGFRPAPLFEGR